MEVPTELSICGASLSTLHAPSDGSQDLNLEGSQRTHWVKLPLRRVVVKCLDGHDVLVYSDSGLQDVLRKLLVITPYQVNPQ
jgi:hypothetical protein